MLGGSLPAKPDPGPLGSERQKQKHLPSGTQHTPGTGLGSEPRVLKGKRVGTSLGRVPPAGHLATPEVARKGECERVRGPGPCQS